MTRTLITTFGVAVLAGALACDSDKATTGGTGGSGGGASGGSAGGSGGSAGGSGGSAGGSGGTSGSGGMGGSGGTSGSGGGGAGGAGGSGGMPDASASDSGGGDAAPGGPANARMSFFLTSEKSTTGNLGGLVMADAKCQRLATVAGAGGKTWKAYLSTETENARTRIGSGPWFNFRGEMIAENLVQLHEEGGMKNTLTQQTALTDTGKIVSGRTVKNPDEGNEHDILTGSLRSGMVKPNAHCNNWTAATGASGVGHGDRMGIQADPVVAASWNDAHEGQCANTAPGGGTGRYYCFATN